MLQDPNCDGFLVILTPQAMTAPTDCAMALTKYAKIQGRVCKFFSFWKIPPFRRSWALPAEWLPAPLKLHDCTTYIPISLHWPGKPVLASWMGGPDVAPGAKVLNDAGIPTYAYPDMVPLLVDSLASFPFRILCVCGGKWDGLEFGSLTAKKLLMESSRRRQERI